MGGGNVGQQQLLDLASVVCPVVRWCIIIFHINLIRGLLQCSPENQCMVVFNNYGSRESRTG